MSCESMDRFTKDCWFLTGPTASGKSTLALALAERFPVEIVALDSMTFYRGMDIGTAKASPADQARVPHHLIDVLDPSESASVDWYLREAERVCGKIRERGRKPLFVGGTPLYLKAALRGLFEGPPENRAIRERLAAEANETGSALLHQRLAAVDPKAAERIHPSDLRRIIRALEVHELTGRPITEWQNEFALPANPPPAVACLTRPRPELYQRINDRVLSMLETGWIDETDRLLRLDPPMSRQAAQAVGYYEIGEFLAGRMDKATMVETIQRRTRRFCKHQETWFRHIEECVILPTEQQEPETKVIERLTAFFRSHVDS
ncbi:MAG: tRNA (adenosine(37)-N6)-dimethylallyltransferase MiaA [Planctomycetota bacterium]